MSTREGDHGRGTFLMRTGYLPQGPIHYPTLGALISKELGDGDAPLPNFVSVAPYRLQVPGRLKDLVRGLHPELKRKVRAGLDLVRTNPTVGQALHDELAGLRSLRVGRFRIVYRVAPTRVIELTRPPSRPGAPPSATGKARPCPWPVPCRFRG